MLNRTLTLMLAFVGALLLLPSMAEASHLRYGHMTWERAAPGSRTINLTYTIAWRSGTGTSVGVNWGDGSSTTIAGTIVATGTDAANEAYEIRRYTASKTYASDGPFTVFYSVCCRISTLVNGRDQTFRNEMVVDLRDANNLGSPVSSIPVILQLPQGGVRNFVLPIADPDGRNYTCRLATNAEAGWGSTSHPTAGGRALSVSSGCLLTWDTTSTSVNQKYATQIVVESVDSPTVDATKVVLDLIIEITGASGTPNCSGSGSGTQTLLVGVPFSASFTGTDPNSSSLTVSHQGLPAGATLTPASGTSGATPFTSTFSWTPTIAQANKSYAVMIVYQDSTRLQGYCSMSFYVDNRTYAVGMTMTGGASQRSEIEANWPQTQTRTFPLTVTNNGSGLADDTYTLSISGGLTGWTRTISPTTMNLPVGQSATATVTVTAPTNLPEAMPVDFTATVVSNTNGSINAQRVLTVYTNPPPPVTGVNTTTAFASGNGSTVTSRTAPFTLSARVTNSSNGQFVTGPGRGLVTFYVAGQAVGADSDADGNGVFSLAWTPGVSFNYNGTQPYTAVYSGVTLQPASPNLMPSNITGTIIMALPVDTDGDGLSDDYETSIGTNPNNPDTDGDGLSDGNEVSRGTNPLHPDTDGDGLTDGNEIARGTNPLQADTDGDAFNDGEEVTAGTDPLNPNSFPLRAPAVTLTSPANNFTCLPTSPAADATTCQLTITGTAGAAGTVTISRNGVTVATVTVSGAQGPFSVNTTALLGGNTFTVTASNAMGSNGATRAGQVIPNTPVILSAPVSPIGVGGADTLSWELQTAPGATILVNRAGLPTQTVTANGVTGRALVNVVRPADGTWTYAFSARGPGGTATSGSVSSTVVVDATAPVVTCPADFNGAWTGSPTEFAMTAMDPSGPLTYAWQVVSEDGQLDSGTGLGFTRTFGPGRYTVTAMATDAVGNVGACTTSLNVDRRVAQCLVADQTIQYGTLVNVGNVVDATTQSSLPATLSYTLNGYAAQSLQNQLALWMPFGWFRLGISWPGDALYHPCTAQANVHIINRPGTSSGTGAYLSNLVSGANDFNFSVTDDGINPASGMLEFRNLAQNVSLEATRITGFGSTFPYSKIIGEARLNGEEGYYFQVTLVDDNGAGADWFHIGIWGGPNWTYNFEAGGPLNAGNFQVQ